MKLKSFFKALGLALFGIALVLFMLVQNPAVEPLSLLFIVAFGTVLGFSGVCLVAGEFIGKIEALESKTRELEEELIKLKNSNKKEN